jgi:DNA-binding NarL/FixJ family response regulator
MQGLRNKEIAARICLSEQTVKTHLNRIFKKFGVSTRAKLLSNLFSSHTKDLILKY